MLSATNSAVTSAGAIVVAVIAAIALLGCDRSATPSVSAGAEPPLVDGLFTAAEVRLLQGMRAPKGPPVDETNEFSGDEQAALLGQRLFFERRLSANGRVSCATCHHPDHGFSMPASLGLGLRTTERHPPALLNVAYQRWYDWDGKADSLWAQAVRPLESEAEHGVTRVEVLRMVAEDGQLRREVEALLGPLPRLDHLPQAARPVPEDPDHPHHQAWLAMAEADREAVNRAFVGLLKAIAAYQERLVSFDAPFDRYLQGLETGDPEALAALEPAAKRGLKLFVSSRANCVTCHNGPLLSDMAFHNLGLGPHVDNGADSGTPDEGRWLGTQMVKVDPFNAAGPYSANPDGDRAAWIRYLKRTAEDHGQFRTPSLRNVAQTDPYMHGGHFRTLEEVVRFYDQLPTTPDVGHREDFLKPLGLTDQEVADLVAFLESLDGQPLPEELLHPPASAHRSSTP